MNKRRLLKLAALLEKDAKRKTGIKFNMNLFADVSNPERPLSCGTEACALGLAALSGAFKRQGLTAHLSNDEFKFRWNGEPTADGFTVARQLFDIDNMAASKLFGLRETNARGAAAERSVAKEIRDFVAAS